MRKFLCFLFSMVFLFVSSLAMAESSIDLQSMSDEDLHFLLSSIEE